MLKTFTLNKRIDKQISQTTGVVTFYITDEYGDSREIVGETFLDMNMQPQGISSKNKRELPLIEGLFRLGLKETISIEFKHYNDLYNRELDKTANQVAYDTVMEFKNTESVITKLSKHFLPLYVFLNKKIT